MKDHRITQPRSDILFMYHRKTKIKVESRTSSFLIQSFNNFQEGKHLNFSMLEVRVQTGFYQGTGGQKTFFLIVGCRGWGRPIFINLY